MLSIKIMAAILLITAVAITINWMMGEEKMVLEVNNSYWSKDESIPLNRALSSNLKLDIAIIGGGYTGLSSAYHLAKMNPNLKIAVFEAKNVGSGASGRHGGMVLSSLPNEYEENSAILWAYNQSVENMKFIDSLSRAFKIDCDLILNGYCQTIYREDEVQGYKQYVKELNGAGIPLEFWDKQTTMEKLGTNLYHGAIFDPNGGSVHAIKLINLLKTAAEKQGVTIYENSPIVSFKEGKTIKLKVNSNSSEYDVEANGMVVATNAYTSKLGIFKNKIMPVHTQVAATEPLSQSQLESIHKKTWLPFFDSRIMLFHLVLTDDNRIVVGGGNVDYYFNNGLKYKGNLVAISDMMLNELVKIYPQLKGIKFEFAWNGILGVTYDEMATVGVMGENNNIYYGLAYNGHGVNQSILFGHAIAHLYQSKHQSWLETDLYGDKLSSLPPEPLKYVGSNMFFKYWKWKDKHN